jgi:hypothetical protein
MKQRFSMTIENIIILLFAILPVVDSVNGILLSRGLPSIGTVYKMGVLALLLLFCIRSGKAQPALLACGLCAVGYIAVSVAVNMFVLGSDLITKDFPIKLAFNALQLVLLLNCHRAGYLTGKGINKIFHISTWLMIVMILVPYGLGLGNTIYSGGIGYKGFFYSNNELSVVLLILFYYSLYRTTMRLSLSNIIQLGGIAVCVLLLNTKSGMIACALGVVLFIVEYLRKPNARFKGLLVVLIVAALLLAKDFILSQVKGFIDRQTYLHTLYGGSFLDTLVSGRTFLLEDAWENFASGEGFLLRFILGNGFCSTTLVEMDFIDLFFYLGVFGVTAVAVVLTVIFCKSAKNFKKDGTWMRPFGYLLMIGFAFLAGHTLFMATSGCYFVLMLCFDLTYYPEEEVLSLGA